MVRAYEPEGRGPDRTDGRGRLHKPAFPTGEVDLSIQAAGVRPDRRRVALEPGEPLELEVRLQRE